MANKKPNTSGLISGARGVPPLETGEISTTVRIRGKKKRLAPFLEMSATERGEFVTQALEGEKESKNAAQKE
jgi:hypothetical protein